MTASLPNRSSLSRQRGAVLVMSMLILIVMTLLGVSSMSGGMLEEKMARNSRDMNTALQAAEVGITDAERFLESAILPAFDGNTAGLYPVDPDGQEYYARGDWSWAGGGGSNGVTAAATYSGYLSDVGQQPQYYIEEVEQTVEAGQDRRGGVRPDRQTTTYYKITAMGTGLSPNVIAVVQTTYKR